MDSHLYSSPSNNGFMFPGDRGQKRNFAIATAAFAVSFAVTVAALAEAFPATLTLWPTTSPANEGTAMQTERTTSAKTFFMLPPLFLAVVAYSIN
jgi:hypothetical protein